MIWIWWVSYRNFLSFLQTNGNNNAFELQRNMEWDALNKIHLYGFLERSHIWIFLIPWNMYVCMYVASRLVTCFFLVHSDIIQKLWKWRPLLTSGNQMEKYYFPWLILSPHSIYIWNTKVACVLKLTKTIITLYNFTVSGEKTHK